MHAYITTGGSADRADFLNQIYQVLAKTYHDDDMHADTSFERAKYNTQDIQWHSNRVDQMKRGVIKRFRQELLSLGASKSDTADYVLPAVALLYVPFSVRVVSLPSSHVTGGSRSAWSLRGLVLPENGIIVGQGITYNVCGTSNSSVVFVVRHLVRTSNVTWYQIWKVEYKFYLVQGFCGWRCSAAWERSHDDA